MLPLILATLFLLGAIIASFVGVVVARLHTGQSFFGGRSRCDACNEPLHPLSLVPLLSYALSGGRARCCGARFSVVGPLSEIVLGGIFALAYLSYGATPTLLGMLVSLSLLTALVLYDLTHQILPPALLYSFVGMAFATAYLSWPTTLVSVLEVALLIGGSLALLHFLSRGRAMGFADAPLAFGLSLVTGPLALSGFIFSFWIGAVVGIVMLAGRPAGSRMGVEVPFAPFLAAGFLLALFTQWNLFAYIAASPW